MCQDVADVDSAEDIIDLGDQPVLVPFDIENRPLANRIRRRKSFSDVRQIPPQSLLRDAKPGVERAFEVAMPRARFLELLAADDMHAAPRKFSILRTLYFANCEDVKPILTAAARDELGVVKMLDCDNEVAKNFLVDHRRTSR